MKKTEIDRSGHDLAKPKSMSFTIEQERVQNERLAKVQQRRMEAEERRKKLSKVRSGETLSQNRIVAATKNGEGVLTRPRTVPVQGIRARHIPRSGQVALSQRPGVLPSTPAQQIKLSPLRPPFLSKQTINNAKLSTKKSSNLRLNQVEVPGSTLVEEIIEIEE